MRRGGFGGKRNFRKKRRVGLVRPMFRRRPPCPFRSAGVVEIDYKDVDLLKQYISDDGKIVPGRYSGVSAKFQRRLENAIKRARYLAFLPYTEAHLGKR